MEFFILMGVFCFILFFVINFGGSKKPFLNDESNLPITQRNFIDINELFFNTKDHQDLFLELKEKIFSGTTITKEENVLYEKKIENLPGDEFSKELLNSLLFALNERDIEFGLPTTKIKLRPKELNFYRSPNAVVDKIDVISKNISYSGFKFNQNAFKMGNMLVTSNDISGAKRFGVGNLFVTNQRVVFTSVDGKTLSIPLGNILSYASYENNGVLFSISNSKPIIVSFPLDGKFNNTHDKNIGIIYNDDKTQLFYALDKVFEERTKIFG